MTFDLDHSLLCAQSRELYLEGRDPVQGALDWKEALWEARRLIIEGLRASKYLTDIAPALEESGRHMLVFRHLLAPPMSQDQFKLLCPNWPKQSEKLARPVRPAAAAAASETLERWLSRRLSPWRAGNRLPSLRELQGTIGAVAPLIASQRVATARRKRLSVEQEQAVIDLLINKQWSHVPSRLVTRGGVLPARHFMHKTRFASGRNENQEVDVACGLGETLVLALECKVTNDATNSVKRINDVLKKASAWKEHWGVFVRPAALLQGVINHADVSRLLDNNVEVFWAHRLDIFSEWLDTNGSVQN